MIELKMYSLPELRKVLNIPEKQWERRKQELLEYLKLFFDYDYSYKGRVYMFNIKEQYAEYEPMPRKTQFKEIYNFYANEVDNILQDKPRNTGSNLAREICDTNNQYNHQESTAASYIRPYLKENYVVCDKTWCRIDYENYTYLPIGNDELVELHKLFETYLNSKDTAEILSSVDAGYDTKDGAILKLRDRYLTAISRFKSKFGYRPYKAGELRRKKVSELEI